MAGVADLVDRATEESPGEQPSATLSWPPLSEVPNVQIVEVLQARSRRLAHEQAQLWATLVEISHRVALEDLPAGSDLAAVVRTPVSMEWAAHEIAAGLAWTPTAADFELATAVAVCERLPLVFTALDQGEIDRGKVLVFVDYLDPDHGEITEEQSHRLCERFVPLASGLTTRQLRDRLLRALRALDADLRRRYRRAVRARNVALWLDPHTGTATLSASGLAPDEAAAAAARLDRLADAAKRAGHPGTRSRIATDLYAGMLNGRFYGLTEHEIIQRLIAEPRPEDQPEPSPDLDSDGSAADGTNMSGGGNADAGDVGDATGASSIGGTGDDSAEDTRGNTEPAGRDDDAGRWVGEPTAVPEGIEIRLGLDTAAGLDDRPGEIPGLGPIDAWAARSAVAAQVRGAGWRFALVDDEGYLLLAGALRRRPRVPGQHRNRVRGGIVEVHLGLDELDRYLIHPQMREWRGVLEEIAAAWDNREELAAQLAANPNARFARGALAEHIRIRDRNCCGPGCTRPARSCDLDHTEDYAFGGLTLDVNLGPACFRHHPDKDRGWHLTQPEPGLFRWVSPLGRVYRTRGAPIRHDYPDVDLGEQSAADGRRSPPSVPEQEPDDEPPPF